LGKRLLRNLWLPILGLLLIGAAGCSAPASEPAAQEGQAVSQVAGPEFGFYSEEKLREHYSKHGAEFGGISRDEYLREAQALRDAPVGGSILQVVRGDTVRTRFDRSNGDFIAFDKDLTIRTFFRPNDGERYFNRQATRPH
jgi:hypothetical protein